MTFRSAVRASYDVALFIPGHPGPAARTHGHRYTVEAVLESETTDDSGFVADFDEVQARLELIVSEIDHRLLNEVEPFRDSVPSAERQAEYFFRRIETVVEETAGPGVRLARVRVIQEPDAWAEFEP